MTNREKDLVHDGRASPSVVRRATRTRLTWALITSFFLLVSLVFLILVELGDTQSGSSILTNINFIKIDVTNVVPTAVPDAQLINSIARTLGLHDFYTVGLWGYCEGYNNVGVTSCSTPQALYWFNPVQIIEDQLVSGAESACLDFIMIFLAPLSVFSRWSTLPIAILTFLAALFITVAAIIGTVMFVIMQDVFNMATQLNISASIGTEMFAFMWIAAVGAILAWLIQMGQLCCCASRRDVKTGRKQGASAAYDTPQRKYWAGRRV